MNRRDLFRAGAAAALPSDAAPAARSLETQVMRVKLRHTWTTVMSSSDYRDTLYVRFTDGGVTGTGEGAPIVRYHESAETAQKAVDSVRPLLTSADPWHFTRIMAEVFRKIEGQWAAKSAIDIALMDWMGQKLGIPLYRHFGLDPRDAPVTTFSIGIDTPEVTRQKTREAAGYPILKVKVGLATDEPTIEAVRSVTKKPLRVDANEGWKDKEEAVRKINWLEKQGVQFVEQPMPASMLEETRWVRGRVHIPLIADEACLHASDIPKLANAFDGVNIKLDRAGGMLGLADDPTGEIAGDEDHVGRHDIEFGGGNGGGSAFAAGGLCGSRRESADLERSVQRGDGERGEAHSTGPAGAGAETCEVTAIAGRGWLPRSRSASRAATGSLRSGGVRVYTGLPEVNMRNGLCFVAAFSLALHAASPPPVILVDGWYPKCTTAPRNSMSTFGQLEAKLNAMGIATQYFRPCSVPVQSSYARATIEELGQALGTLIEQTIQQTGASQVDVIAFSMGSPTVRAYVSGKQNAPGVFQPPDDHKIRKAVFLGGLFFGVGNGHAPVPDPQDDALCTGTPFQWDLNTWNQGGGDLRGIDAIAVAGSGHATPVGSLMSDGDGVASLSTASLTFAYPAERTRIITACHVSELCMPTVSYVNSDLHPTWLIIKSFLAGTDEWKAVGSSPDKNDVQSANGGIFVAVKDASDNLINATRVSLGGRVLDWDSESGPGLFYVDRVAKGDYILQATTGIPVPDVSFSPTPGTYSMVTMKPGPLISAVVPSDSGKRQPAIPAGSAIEIRGARLTTGGTTTAADPFPTSLSGTEVRINNQPIPLKSVSEAQIRAQLPAGLAGFVRLTVITNEGAHSFNMFLEDTHARPRVAQSGVVNAASFVHGAVAPGEFVTITGTNLGPAHPVMAAGSEKGLGGTKVAFNGIEAFLTYSSVTQVNALVPYGVSGKADMTVEYNGAVSGLFPLAVADSAPGIFTKNYGPGQAWALNDDSSFNSAVNPVGRGGWIVFWATGQGLVNPAGQDGETMTTPKNVNLPVKVTIDGIEAPLLYAVLVYTGEIQVAASIPGSARTGDVPLLLTIGAARSRSDVTISVK